MSTPKRRGREYIILVINRFNGEKGENKELKEAQDQRGATIFSTDRLKYSEAE